MAFNISLLYSCRAEKFVLVYLVDRILFQNSCRTAQKTIIFIWLRITDQTSAVFCSELIRLGTFLISAEKKN